MPHQALSDLSARLKRRLMGSIRRYVSGPAVEAAISVPRPRSLDSGGLQQNCSQIRFLVLHPDRQFTSDLFRHLFYRSTSTFACRLCSRKRSSALSLTSNLSSKSITVRSSYWRQQKLAGWITRATSHFIYSCTLPRIKAKA